ncbi:hypothetical protein EJ08DRAFT_451747 [Tothia fuscella]|uniref:Uncharacterized protein n=1 Tax=Tothia fuscella TaxID=1048955 RepID=A0A9P4TUT2_9PEZI|nr:hypothetical protein EJ08DRAFT_451747 [Tothia fuscella]
MIQDVGIISPLKYLVPTGKFAKSRKVKETITTCPQATRKSQPSIAIVRPFSRPPKKRSPNLVHRHCDTASTTTSPRPHFSLSPENLAFSTMIILSVLHIPIFAPVMIAVLGLSTLIYSKNRHWNDRGGERNQIEV